jgi:hypothetical protein
MPRLAILPVWFASAGVLLAQSDTFRAEANLALVRFQVVGDRNRPVQDLRPDDVEIREDGVPQKTALFGGGRLYPRTTPLKIHLLFDRNINVQIIRSPNPRQYRMQPLEEFPHVSIGVWGFSQISLICFTRPTRDAARLNWAMGAVTEMPPRVDATARFIAGNAGRLDSVTSISPGAGKPRAFDNSLLYRATVEVVRSAGAEIGDSVPAVVVVSHADPNAEDATVGDALVAARTAGVTLFPVWTGPRGWKLTPVFTAWIDAFLGLGAATGGSSHRVVGGSSSAVLSEILKWLSDQVRYDYVAGYYPISSGEKKAHTVQVVLKDPNRGRVVGGARTVER